MSLFKKGDVVYMGKQRLVVKKVIDNPLLPCYQYTFKGTNMACACQVLSDTLNGERYKLSDDFKEDNEDKVQTIINTTANLKNNVIAEVALGINVFFKPDFVFCNWLKEYAGDRMIIDVGCGQGHFLRMMKRTGIKIIGLEPNFDHMAYMISKTLRGSNFDPNEILPWDIERAKNLIQGLKNKVLLVFARSCHSNFVVKGIDNLLPTQEALYITVPENLELYNDLGFYRKRAVLLDHKGTSEDGEVVYSITK